DEKDPGMVLTETDTRLKVLLSCDAAFVTRMVAGATSEWQTGGTLDPELPISTVTESREEISSKKENTAISRGRICVQLKDEMLSVRYMAKEGGQSIKEIQAATPNFRVWEMAESENLTAEDRYLLLHPNQWAPGYAALILAKWFHVTTVTIRDYITKYNR